MPIRGLIALFFVGALACFGVAFLQHEPDFAQYGIPLIVIAAVLFVLRPQVEWWWYQRKTPDLDMPMVELFKAKLPNWYQKKSQREKETFRKRVFLTELAHDFKGQGFEDEIVPADFCFLLASQAARVLEPDATYVLKPFEVVVAYKHPFPSPSFPEVWHNSELFEEDGVLLFNLDRAIPGIFEPQEHFNIVLYEWFRVKKMANQANAAKVAQFDSSNWQTQVELLTGKPSSWVIEAIGLEEDSIDGQAVLEVIAMEFGGPIAKLN